MKIPISRNATEPIYRQIEHYIQLQIESGALAAGMKLPPNRKMAEILGVSRVVVAKAYAQLEMKGLVYSRTGSGTFVARVYEDDLPVEAPAKTPGLPFWQQEILHHSWKPHHQDLEKMLNSGAHTDVISFAERISGDEIWPIDELRRSINRVFQLGELPAVHQSGISMESFSGLLPLKLAIARNLSGEGILTAAEEIVVTSGVQQAIYLVTKTLLKPGDLVVTENPTNYMAIDLFRSLDARLISISVDEDGMQVDRLADTLRNQHPRLIYVSPTFHNPTGTCLSRERRSKLVTLANDHNIPVLEDDSFGHFRFDDRDLPALKAMDPGGCIIYTASFSTDLVPGIRLGYLAASGPVLSRLMAEKYVSDPSTSELLQKTLLDFINSGRYQPYLRKAARLHRQRRDTMIEALDHYIPEEIQWSRPKGGVFLWLRLPKDLSTYELFRFAVREGVTYVPGRFFFPGESPDNFLRLDFSINSADRIPEGIRRLAAAYQRYIRSVEEKTGRKLSGLQ